MKAALSMTTRKATPLLLFASLLACGGDSSGPPAPTTGTLDFHFVTTGSDIDFDGFLLAVDAGTPQAIPANGTLQLTAERGGHSIAITGNAFNCDVNAPLSANVTPSSTTTVTVQGTCTPYLSNAILYTSPLGCCKALMIARANGSRHEQISTSDASYYGPAVSPDGQTIAVASGPATGGFDGIFLLDRFGKGRTKVVGRSAEDVLPTWSPDGSKLAFRSLLSKPDGDVGRIFIVNRDGSGLRQLTPDSEPGASSVFDDSPAWSPDGTRIAFARNGQLFMINPDGTGLTPLGITGVMPAWARDGTKLVYSADGLYTMDLTFVPRRLTSSPDFLAHWSPDGHQVVFQRVDGTISHIFKINSDGSGAARLTNVIENEMTPTWSPN
jgi:Tol biopolymer transport system component